jgi:hypothetical protein
MTVVKLLFLYVEFSFLTALLIGPILAGKPEHCSLPSR